MSACVRVSPAAKAFGVLADGKTRSLDEGRGQFCMLEPCPPRKAIYTHNHSEAQMDAQTSLTHMVYGVLGRLFVLNIKNIDTYQNLIQNTEQKTHKNKKPTKQIENKIKK